MIFDEKLSNILWTDKDTNGKSDIFRWVAHLKILRVNKQTQKVGYKGWQPLALYR